MSKLNFPPPPSAPPAIVPIVHMQDIDQTSTNGTAATPAPVPPTTRLVYGSLEGQLRAATASSPTTATPTSASGLKQPVSFNNRTALLSTSASASPDSTTASASPPVPKVLNESIRLGMAAGNINISSMSADTFALSEATQAAKAEQAAMLREMEIKKKARSVVVPTNDNLVRKRLRELGEPITIFGERIPGRRERLSGVLARKVVEESLAAGGSQAQAEAEIDAARLAASAKEKENKAFLTPGTEELKQARIAIAKFSFERAALRIKREKEERELDNQDSAQTRIKSKEARISRLSKLSNFCSEVGDGRPIASVAFSSCSTRLASASWSGISKIWSLTPSTKFQYELKGHKESVTDIQWTPLANVPPMGVNLASCSMDSTVMLWPAPVPDPATTTSSDDMVDTISAAASTSLTAAPPAPKPTLTPLATLNGHTERCCRLAFHPSGRYLGSTSFDKTWRLWDLETQKELLKQQGHTKATYAIAFQKDGALAATGDLGGVGHLWDLRTGHTVLGLIGHAKQMLAADFHPNGVHLATASDDHTVRIWDLRKQTTLYTIGAHSNLISNVRWDPLEGLYLLTSSYDQTSKIWHGTDFTLLKTLAGHEGRVMRAEIAPSGAFIATSAYDRTWKLFAYED